MLLQQLEVGSVRGHQLYRHPYIAEGFAVAKVVGDDVRIQCVIGESRLDGGGGLGSVASSSLAKACVFKRVHPRDSSRILKIFIWMARQRRMPHFDAAIGAVKHGCSYNSPLIYG